MRALGSVEISALYERLVSIATGDFSQSHLSAAMGGGGGGGGGGAVVIHLNRICVFPG